MTAGLIDRIPGKGGFISKKFKVRITVVIDNLFACDNLTKFYTEFILFAEKISVC